VVVVVVVRCGVMGDGWWVLVMQSLTHGP